MLWLRFGLLFLVLHTAPAAVFAQPVLVPPDSLGLMQTQVKRIGIDTYTGLNYLNSHSVTDTQELSLDFSHNWIYNSSASVKGFIRQDYLLRVAQLNRLGKSDFWAGQEINYSEFQANRTAILRLLQAYRHQSSPVADVVVRSRAFGGIRRDQRFGKADFGPEIGGGSTIIYQPAASSGSAGASVLLNHARVGPREFRRFQADVYYQSPENRPATAQVRAGFYKVNSADYLAGNVQNINSDTLFADLKLAYRISSDLNFRSVSLGTLPSRQFTYRQQAGGSSEQQNFGYRQGQYETVNRLQYFKNNLDATVEFAYRERTRVYRIRNNRGLSGTELRNAEERERTKDIRENNFSWAWNVLWKFTAKHTLQGQTTAQLLRLNTPSTLNNQDRDEVYYVGRLSLESRWQQSFRTTFAIAAEDKQFVYITAGQSIENYRDRILRWEPGFIWVPGKFSWAGTVQLWATYHVRDARTEQLKNRANRTYVQNHVLALELPLNFRLQVQYNRRENRTGLLNWENFSESPLDTITSHDISVGAEKKWLKEGRQTALRLGYRMFHQAHNRVSGRQIPAGGMRTIYLTDVTRQHGPELALLQHKTGLVDISVTLWLQVVDTFSKYKTSSEPYYGAGITEQQLQQKLHALYPYFSCSLSWYFGGLLKSDKGRPENKNGQ